MDHLGTGNCAGHECRKVLLSHTRRITLSHELDLLIEDQVR